jgi:hypothetical protein
MTPAGTLITLHSFDDTDGPYPVGPVVATSEGLYGTTVDGGVSGDGSVFSISLGLGGTTPSTTNLSLSPSTIYVGLAGPVIMTATVAPGSGSATPTGLVDFFFGSNELGLATLSNGMATYSYNPSSLAVDTYQFTAVYSGDGTFATSTSAAETLTVTSSPPAATPSFSPPSGTYNAAQTVTIADTTPGATIYFTTDGTTPTTGSEVYNGPITVNSTETIKAIAGASGYSDSAVMSATYTISLSPDYRLSVTPSSLTIVAGQSGTATFTVTPMNGFDAQVSFACSGLPSGATCSFAPPSVTPSGNSPVSSTVTISTTSASAALRGLRPSPYYLSYALLIPGLGIVLGIPTDRKRTLGRFRIFGMLALVAFAAGMTSCGNSSQGASPDNLGTPLGDAVQLP